MTTVPWKRIGFEVLLLNNLLVKLESTTYVVGMGYPSMAREGGRMRGHSSLTPTRTATVAWKRIGFIPSYLFPIG